MEKINVKQFEEKYDSHKISTAEKDRWWGKRTVDLFTYKPKWLFKSEQPMSLKYKCGTQSFVKYIELISDDPYMRYSDNIDNKCFTSVLFSDKDKCVAINIPFDNYMISWRIPIKDTIKVETFKEALNLTEKRFVSDDILFWVNSNELYPAWKSGVEKNPEVINQEGKKTRYSDVISILDDFEFNNSVRWKETIKKSNVPFSEEYHYARFTEKLSDINFNIVLNSGKIELLAQKRLFHEYMIDGKRCMFVAVKSEGDLKNPLTEILKKHNKYKGEINWYFTLTEDNTPYVLSEHAVEMQWLPIHGYSALPVSVEKQIPDKLRYWEYTDRYLAQKVRKELIKKGVLDYNK